MGLGFGILVVFSNLPDPMPGKHMEDNARSGCNLSTSCLHAHAALSTKRLFVFFSFLCGIPLGRRHLSKTIHPYSCQKFSMGKEAGARSDDTEGNNGEWRLAPAESHRKAIQQLPACFGKPSPPAWGETYEGMGEDDEMEEGQEEQEAHCSARGDVLCAVLRYAPSVKPFWVF